ncbi:CopG family transcriptional regulator [Candidatus Nomurabacteria bacterium]|nr:CopG family transcriptional regulator [Candidatus Nomurabacteria bacterium]
MSEVNEEISESRLGVVGIILESPDENVARVNDILHDFAGIIVGRMGIPYRQRGVAVIALTVDGTTDEIGAMTGKIGQIKDVTVKTALAPKK